MQDLIRKHHSLFILNNEEQLNEFIRFADENKHIRDLLLLEAADILETRRVAFNIWQYFSNEDSLLVVNIEQRMIYPSTAFLLATVRKNNAVANFKHNYGKELILLFVASIYITNALFYWYHRVCVPQLPETPDMRHFLNSDFYMLFVEQKKSGDGYPKEFAGLQARELRVLMEAAEKDRTVIKKLIEDAIFDAKKIYHFVSYRGGYKKR